MGGGYFVVQFSSAEAYQEAMLEGPWTLLGSYLLVQSWTTAFRVHHSSPPSTVVWIRISDLPLHLYPSEVITAIGGAVGTVIRVDTNTSGMQRGKFARLAVSVDLTKPLVSKLSIDGEEFKIEYENLQDLCFYCGMYGHRCDACIHRPKEVEKCNQGNENSRTTITPMEVYGPWMVVEKKRRQQGKARDIAGGQGGDAARAGSWYDVLRNVEEEGTKEADLSSLRENHVVTTGALTNLQQGHNKKNKQVVFEEILSSQSQHHRSRNSRPPKTTFGEFFYYTNKARMDERVVPTESTLDAQTHSVVQIEKGPSGREDQGQNLGQSGAGLDVH